MFVFFHSVVEMFAVVVAMLIFVTGYRSHLSVRKGAVVVLGVAFFGVGLLDLLHTLSYAGMPIGTWLKSAPAAINYGGEKLKKGLEIKADDTTIAKLESRILTKPV